MNIESLKPQWLDAFMQCAETLFVVDEKTKQILWTNDASASTGEHCYRAFFGKAAPCAFCPALALDEVYVWDYYNDRSECWLKIKSKLFLDGDRLLRAVNLNAIDDAMNLCHESVEQLAALQKLLAENRRIKNALENEAIHDRMTGLFNRNKFNLDVTSGLYDRAGTGILYFDLNNLKEVNDLLRHEAGDRLIVCLANAIAGTAGQFSSARAYRIGGDEFVLIMSDCTEKALADARAIFDRLIHETTMEPPCVTAVGSAYSRAPGDVEELVSAADRAMYADKRRLKGESGRTL